MKRNAVAIIISLAPVFRGEGKGEGEGQLRFHFSIAWIFGRIILTKRKHGVNAGSFPPHPSPLLRSTGGEGTFNTVICYLIFDICYFHY